VALKIVERGVRVLGVVGSLGCEMISDVPTELCCHVYQLLGSDWIFVLFFMRLAPDRPIGSSGLLCVDIGEIRLLQRQRMCLGDDLLCALGKERAEVVGESKSPGSRETDR
jgi:hypothetical protein